MMRRDKREPLFMISVVSRMLGVHPQTLRLYEREGLICPKRSSRKRLYSEEDVERLKLILRLTRDMGVNKAGVDIILRLRDQFEFLHREVEEMMELLNDDMRDEFRLRLRDFFRK
ncbi:MAG: MerR family transcriptional regulator [Thermodesulfovibrionales bacterium]